MKGVVIRSALEKMLARAPTPFGAFPQVSHNCKIVYDWNMPKGSRVREVSVATHCFDNIEQDASDFEPLENEREYLVGLSLFMSRGGDEIYDWGEGELITEVGGLSGGTEGVYKSISEITLEFLEYCKQYAEKASDTKMYRPKLGRVTNSPVVHE